MLLNKALGPNLVPCPNVVLPSLEPPAHSFRALESCWHAGEGLPYRPVTSRGSSGAANDRAGEEYQVRARYQIRANALLVWRYLDAAFLLPPVFPSRLSLVAADVLVVARDHPRPLYE